MQFRLRISHWEPYDFLTTELPKVLDPILHAPIDNLAGRSAVVIPEQVQSEEYAASQKPAEDPAVGFLDNVSNPSWKLNPEDVPIRRVSKLSTRLLDTGLHQPSGCDSTDRRDLLK